MSIPREQPNQDLKKMKIAYTNLLSLFMRYNEMSNTSHTPSTGLSCIQTDGTYLLFLHFFYRMLQNRCNCHIAFLMKHRYDSLRLRKQYDKTMQCRTSPEIIFIED